MQLVIQANPPPLTKPPEEEHHLIASPAQKQHIENRAKHEAETFQHFLQLAIDEVHRISPNIIDVEIIAPNENANVPELKQLYDAAIEGYSNIRRVNTPEIIQHKKENWKNWYQFKPTSIINTLTEAKDRIGRMGSYHSEHFLGVCTVGDAFQEYAYIFSQMKSLFYQMIGPVLDEFMNGDLTVLGYPLPSNPGVNSDELNPNPPATIFERILSLYETSYGVQRPILFLKSAIALTTNHMIHLIHILPSASTTEQARKLILTARVTNAQREALEALQPVKNC